MGTELKRLHHPYDLHGRWYKLFIESDGSTVKVTTSDIECELEASAIKFPKGFHVIDRIYDIHSIPHASTVTILPDLYGFADGSQGIYKPVANAFDYADIYVYGYFEG